MNKQTPRFHSGHEGFTIIELVVAMGVFLSLFLIVIVNFRSGESVNELKLETQKIASDIRKVQTLALTGSYYNGVSIGSGVYGVKFTAGVFTYDIFKDKNRDGVYTYSADGDLLESRSLVSNINALEFNPVKTDVYIVFKPYSSEISINADGSVMTSAIEIRIQHSRATGKTGIITAVPVSGKIDFKLQ